MNSSPSPSALSSSCLSSPHSPTPSSSTISSSVIKLKPEPDHVYIDPLITLAPTPANLTKIAIQLVSTNPNNNQIHQVFTSAYLRAASTGDSDLLDWLLSSNNHSPQKLSSETINLTSPPSNINNRSSTPNLSSSPNSSLILSPRRSRASSFSNPIQSNLTSPRHPIQQNTSSNPSPPTKPIILRGRPRQWIDLDARDEDGSPAIILAAAFGHAEAVRAIVDGLGDLAVNSRDAVGWTALHWAARNGDLTIVSYLLNHGASTSLVSFTDRLHRSHSNLTSSLDSRPCSCSNSTFESDFHPSSPIIANGDISNLTPTAQGRSKRRKTPGRGLRPHDLTKHDEEGEMIRQILRIAEQTKVTSPSHSRSQSQASLRSIRLAEAQSEADLARLASNKIIELARLCSKTLEIDPVLLGLSTNSLHQTTRGSEFSLEPSHSQYQQDIITGLLASLNSEWEEEQQSEEFHWDRCEPDQMLVCSMAEIPRIFDAVIKTVEPRQARTDRFVPANVLFLCARYAAHMGTIELLEELLLGAVDMIEEIIFARHDNMANSTFWLFNAICLLYYVRRDPLLKELTKEIQTHIEDLINEIYVFIIRDAERRLDKLIDSTILDFESLPDLAVDFEPEGSWRFVRALTVKRNRNSSSRLTIPGFNHPLAQISRPPTSSTQPLSSFPNLGSPAGHGPRATRSTPAPASQKQNESPILVIDLLSSVLYLLQAYEIHGSVIVQTFSQVFYWLSCEIFNRIITKRKYLCRSKAKQIERNLTVIEEWAKMNRLPIKLVDKHFVPLKQLLRWIQILSSINGTQSFDRLIESISTLKKINPAQLLKVSRDYRFEIDEPKLEEECRQYLVQTQQDWDRRRIQRVNQLEAEERHNLHPEEAADGVTSPHSASSACDHSPQSQTINKDDGLKKAIEAIDLAFGSDDHEAYGSYDPPLAPECLGELLDSRQMLPFGLPTSNEVLMKLKSTVPFGSFKSYLIPDLPKPGRDWWTSSSLPSDEEEDFLEEESEEIKEDKEVCQNTTPTSTPLRSSKSIPHPSSPLTTRCRRRSSTSASNKMLQKITPQPVVPIVSTQVLKRIDHLVFQSSTCSTFK